MAQKTHHSKSRKSGLRACATRKASPLHHAAAPPPEAAKDRQKVLVLQGGGARGAYQAGAFEALAECGLSPDWVSGTSIGAINCALIAGNPPEKRIAALRNFWERVSGATAIFPFIPFGVARESWSMSAAIRELMFGVPGFYRPRFPNAWLTRFNDPTQASYFDATPLRETLLELADFDRLNDGKMRVSLGTVNVETGNMTYFDSTETTITPDHVIASGALPPAFAPVQIEGALFWDGGLVSNAPLQYVLEDASQINDAGEEDPPLLIYQVDLFSAVGEAPHTLYDADMRQKEIRFSSRNRAATRRMQILARVAEIARRLGEKLPPELHDDPDLALLQGAADYSDVTLIHLIYRHGSHESGAMDYEFSRPTMLEHWQAGVRDVQRSHANADWDALLQRGEGMKTFDLNEL
ncbi:patatin-like phospholipase family protein [Thioclava sp.]|uniref:patatin-like phospholipase family protein n=1 Tax=Thioclava sp. TaxID=1933450 RepID=UPI003AA8316C